MLVWIVVLLIALRLLLQLKLVKTRKSRHTVKTAIVLGSGGHTAEMISLLAGFDPTIYTPRCYFIAATDKMSTQKAHTFEVQQQVTAVNTDEYPHLKLGSSESGSSREGSPANHHQSSSPQLRARRALFNNNNNNNQNTASTSSAMAPTTHYTRRRLKRDDGSDDRGVRGGSLSPEQAQATAYQIIQIPRSREVGQSFKSSIKTTLIALYAAMHAVFRLKPDFLLVNGPGTCIPVCIAALLTRALGLAEGRIVYVESIARVYRLSLSGKILYHCRLTDAFYVQWEELLERYPKASFAGRLM